MVNKKNITISIVIIAISLLIMLTGVVFGQLDKNILPKAIRICLECVGIG